jgi:hypothetical protein
MQSRPQPALPSIMLSQVSSTEKPRVNHSLSVPVSAMWNVTVKGGVHTVELTSHAGIAARSQAGCA